MDKFYYQITLAYDGQKYFGWQIQSETDSTIQGILNNSFKEATGITKFRTIGSGRTDAGVHALEQVVLFEVLNKLPESVFLKGVNQRLPSDIKIMSVKEVDQSFHPIFSAQSKIYEYVLALATLPPFLGKNFLSYSYPIDIKTLKSGIKCFVGEYDFCNYFCVGTEVSSTVRTILSASVTNESQFTYGDYAVSGKFLKFEFTGTGFLKQQVRLMMGALLSLNEGKISLSELEDSLKGHKIKHLAPVAPACGLYLKSVQY